MAHVRPDRRLLPLRGTTLAASPKRSFGRDGLRFGLVIFLAMNYIVVPLSAVGHVPHFETPKLIENLSAMLNFGWISSFFARQ